MMYVSSFTISKKFKTRHTQLKQKLRSLNDIGLIESTNSVGSNAYQELLIPFSAYKEHVHSLVSIARAKHKERMKHEVNKHRITKLLKNTLGIPNIYAED
ncbi:hypothetical protein [Photobacterium leiognathi]|uniref:hypothetical protein n=1 Tax=Photobacterium leiognathi TaxID=553611 RepID=UPI002982B1BE|nr:hypothetical protein [Photobacterium leiognathi]